MYMCIHLSLYIYIYIYIFTDVSLSLICIYTYMYMSMFGHIASQPAPQRRPQVRGNAQTVNMD